MKCPFVSYRWRTDESFDEIPYSHHPYAYTLGDPVLYTDPAGTYAVDEDGCRAGMVWNARLQRCDGPYHAGGGGDGDWNGGRTQVGGYTGPVVPVRPPSAPPVAPQPRAPLGPGMPFEPVTPPAPNPGWLPALGSLCLKALGLVGSAFALTCSSPCPETQTQPQPLSQPTAPTPSEQTPTPQRMSVFKPGADMPQTTQHIIDAIAIGNPSIVTYRGPNNGHSRGWLRSTPACRGNSLTQWCDEYPFASVNEGGQANNPSLRIVPASEQRVQAGKWTGFLSACQVATGEKVKIEPSLSLPQTTWSCK